ncbi:MAG: PAS domain S-box protein [Limisphaerales bacterium]
MAKLLRVLLVEDSETDALLVLRELRRGNYVTESRRVDSAASFATSLESEEWDIIICDYRMPGFDGFSALELYRKAKKDAPFIVVSGMIGEDVAVQMMKAGAHDYLLKDNLARLVPAVDRELREASERKDLVRAERARAHLAAIVASSDDAIISSSLDGVVLSWNNAAQRMFGYTADEIQNQTISLLIPEEQESDRLPLHRKVLKGEQVRRYRTIGQRKDGTVFHLSLTISPIIDQEGNITSTSTIARDITDLKKAEAEKEQLLCDLKTALSQVKTLSGLLPICSGCKKIRDDKGYWQQVEIYIKRYSNAEFTHGFCPDCMQAYYPEYVKKIQAATLK